MASREWAGLNEREVQVIRTTATEHQRELALMENLLRAYVAGFGAIGSFKPTEDNELQYAWLRLVARSFNSMRCAYDALLRGYYIQALMLLRSVDEDWLVCGDCEKHPPTLDALLREKGRLGRGELSYGKMAERQQIEHPWGEGYGFLSTIYHPRRWVLEAQVDLKSRTLRLGAHYDRSLFLLCCEVLVRASLRMTKYLVKLLGSGGNRWMKKNDALVGEARHWLEQLEELYTGSDAGGSSSD